MFTTCAIPGGFVVAFRSPCGGLNAVLDCRTREIAEREARYLNSARAAEIERQRLRDIAMQRNNPRPVRWFEPDAFA